MSRRDFGRGRLIDAGAGLTHSLQPRTCYSVSVITLDVGAAICSAGGWMADRARAGWRVSTLVPHGSDTRPLQILGAHTAFFDSELDDSYLSPPPATVAVGAEMLASQHPIAAQVSALQRNRELEFTVWGSGELDSERPFQMVQHRLSPAGALFKAHAMNAASLPPMTADTEHFRTTAPWYPLDHGAEPERAWTRDSSIDGFL